MVSALLDLYEASLEAQWIDSAREVADALLDNFADSEHGGFYFTAKSQDALIVRSKPSFDGSTPSGNSAAALALLRLHSYTGDERYMSAAAGTLRLFSGAIEQQPFAFAHLLEAIDLYQRGAVEIALVGGDPAQAKEWFERIGKIYLPNRALYLVNDAVPIPAALPGELRNRPALGGQLTAYVCRSRTCSAPITSLDALMEELRD
jgi:uncharacterized protein YyaL (SSP411 family)